jgi:PIN domain nuclease of toxin-antitoxin system
MKALLDTHTFLWWTTEDSRLSKRVDRMIREGSNVLYLSAASGWEMAIKAKIGKLKVQESIERLVLDRLSRYSMLGLPIQLSHALHVETLPPHHRDPFDRMLVAQSQVEEMPILTSDPLIAQYDVEVIW